MANKAMTKTQIVSHIAERANITKKESAGILEELADLAVKETKRSGQFVIPGIGKLVKSNRKARKGRNPQTGEELQIPAKTAPAGYVPWYEARTGSEPAIVFGHWSALGLRLTERIAALDTGCVWGGTLTALRLEDRWLVQVPCPGYQPIGE